jgi:hypothetical protein
VCIHTRTYTNTSARTHERTHICKLQMIITRPFFLEAKYNTRTQKTENKTPCSFASDDLIGHTPCSFASDDLISIIGLSPSSLTEQLPSCVFAGWPPESNKLVFVSVCVCVQPSNSDAPAHTILRTTYCTTYLNPTPRNCDALCHTILSA